MDSLKHKKWRLTSPKNWHEWCPQEIRLYYKTSSRSKLSSEAVARRCFSKYMLLKISQISLENTCIGVSLIKLQAD